MTRPLIAVVAALAALVAMVVASPRAQAHGATTNPASRTYACYVDGLTGGQIIPKNAACAAAVAQGGTQPLYDWYGVLRSDGAGRTRGYIPDGQLCSGGNPKYAAYDLPRTDWPSTNLTSGARYNFVYGAWVPHPGAFRLYVTKQGYNPSQPLTWSMMEEQPFFTADPQPALDNGAYRWTANLPVRTGRHVIYAVWTRSDSAETFYSCSDVVFGGSASPSPSPSFPAGCEPGAPTPAPSCPPVSPSPSPSFPGGCEPGAPTPAPSCPPVSPSPSFPAGCEPGAPTPAPSCPPVSPSPTPNPTGQCTVTAGVASAWNNGFQGSVTIRNTGSTPVSSWTATATVASGATVTSAWNAAYTQSGTTLTFRPLSWNTTIPPGGTITIGFLSNFSGGGTPTVTAGTCR
ncbi:lytic polysaccharide monooxygenase [Herbidospora cretacea]|uniref:lytic polysaccharide monooxygenase n=1 Tax=Herbidospora cretacea TaxID=28444 RepID=UPI0005592DE5|nr:lytic polysaccharide monooxygenase [Herbidospora cretacea]